MPKNFTIAVDIHRHVARIKFDLSIDNGDAQTLVTNVGDSNDLSERSLMYHMALRISHLENSLQRVKHMHKEELEVKNRLEEHHAKIYKEARDAAKTFELKCCELKEELKRSKHNIESMFKTQGNLIKDLNDANEETALIKRNLNREYQILSNHVKKDSSSLDDVHWNTVHSFFVEGTKHYRENRALETSPYEALSVGGVLFKFGYEHQRLRTELSKARKEIKRLKNYEPKGPKFDKYTMAVVKQMADTLGLSYEELSREIPSSYSSAREAMKIEQEMMMQPNDMGSSKFKLTDAQKEMLKATLEKVKKDGPGVLMMRMMPRTTSSADDWVDDTKQVDLSSWSSPWKLGPFDLIPPTQGEMGGMDALKRFSDAVKQEKEFGYPWYKQFQAMEHKVRDRFTCLVGEEWMIVKRTLKVIKGEYVPHYTLVRIGDGKECTISADRVKNWFVKIN